MEHVVLETSKSLAKELGSSTTHVVKQKIVKDAKNAQKLAEEIRNSAAEKVGKMLIDSMKLEREQDSSEAAVSGADLSRGNGSYTNLSDNTIDLNPLSPFDKIPLNKVYTNLHKDLFPSPSTKPSINPYDDVVEPMQPSINDRMNDLIQRRINTTQRLLLIIGFNLPF